MTQHNAGQPFPAPKSPWKQWGTWGLLGFLVASGALAGASITEYFVQRDANKQIEAVRAAYNEAGEARLSALQICLRHTTGAADKAATAATEAATRAEAAQEAADKAAAAAAGNENADVCSATNWMMIARQSG